MSTHQKVKTRLGDLLLEKGLITEEQLHLAIQIQKTDQLQLGEILVANGWVTKRQINKAGRYVAIVTTSNGVNNKKAKSLFRIKQTKKIRGNIAPQATNTPLARSGLRCG